MTRSRVRTDELTGQALNLEDANTTVAHVVAATAPMFTAPVSNSVPNPSRH